ncbi:hypothetical protein AOXY_G5565 [Acipenser oxyrinchus oxyrinchus]|uniref:Uncharacterized protein n=1 Tax=Acipenser oxyrinchus oxyrinchus TaxID=40147 RepID=A0AAD8GEC4_ACIOX|nr:hypothetical protein AOXY_G5565 [Acipenser oxyrinchus oxyrinchus]
METTEIQLTDGTTTMHFSVSSAIKERIQSDPGYANWLFAEASKGITTGQVKEGGETELATKSQSMSPALEANEKATCSSNPQMASVLQGNDDSECSSQSTNSQAPIFQGSEKKWNNLLVTYKRAKDRSRETGQGRITWEYFEAIDSLLSKTVGAPPPTGSISCTPLFPTAAHSSPTVTPHISPLPAPCTDSTPIPSQTQTLDTTCLTSPPPSVTPSTSKSQAHAHNRRETQAADASHSFLQQYENHAERHTAVIESLLEKREEKQEKRRKRLWDKRKEQRDTEMLACLKQMSSTLQSISAKQDHIIVLLEKRS